jgi:phosphate transport system ATP-binding protein
MAKMTTDGLSASYGGPSVIHEISLDFNDRSVTAIIGPSGCGKSTLIRCLNRMHETVPKAKVSGKVLLDGSDIYDQDATQVRRRIGMVFQRPNPFATMTIFDNVAASLRFNGKHSRPETDEIVLKSLQAAALWDEVSDKLFKPATSLSGGQQQRLCIARALAAQPEVLLMDEPCSALDPISTAKIEDLIFGLKRQYCVIIVTHNMQQAARVADRTAFLYLGKLVEYNDTKEMFERPKEKLTEAYVSGRFG